MRGVVLLIALSIGAQTIIGQTHGEHGHPNDRNHGGHPSTHRHSAMKSGSAEQNLPPGHHSRQHPPVIPVRPRGPHLNTDAPPMQPLAHMHPGSPPMPGPHFNPGGPPLGGPSMNTARPDMYPQGAPQRLGGPPVYPGRPALPPLGPPLQPPGPPLQPPGPPGPPFHPGRPPMHHGGPGMRSSVPPVHFEGSMHSGGPPMHPEGPPMHPGDLLPRGRPFHPGGGPMPFNVPPMLHGDPPPLFFGPDMIGDELDRKIAEQSSKAHDNKHAYGVGPCSTVTIIEIGRPVSFDQCKQICHDHDGVFYAPGSHAEGACLEQVPGAKKPFWINTIQVFPHWSKSEGSFLENVFTDRRVINFSPIVNRNSPNGVKNDGGLNEGKGQNCLYHRDGQLFGTSCQGQLAKHAGCACDMNGHIFKLPCEAIKIMQTKNFVHSTECPDVCGPLRFFAPSNVREMNCLNDHYLTRHPTWVNMMQFMAAPESKIFPILSNQMTSKMVTSYETNKHRPSPFQVTPDQAYTKGVAQNCIYFKHGVGLVGTRCQTGQMTRQCACVPWPRDLHGQGPQIPAGPVFNTPMGPGPLPVFPGPPGPRHDGPYNPFKRR